MSDENQTDQTDDDQNPDPEDQTDAGTADDEDVQDDTPPELLKARSEAKKYRLQLREVQKELAEIRKAGQTDDEKRAEAAKELETKQAELETANRQLRVRVLAGEIGIVDSEAAAALLPWGEIEDPNDDEDIRKALKKLVRSKPYLAGAVAGGADGGSSGRTAAPEDMNALIRAKAGRS